MTTKTIYQTAAPGLGRVLCYDAAQDVGMAGLIDTTLPWAWGGALPDDGYVLTGGEGPRNIVNPDHGWTQDYASAVAGTFSFTDAGVSFDSSQARFKLPSGFKPRADDTHFGLIWWMANLPQPAGTGFNNRIFDVREGGVSKYFITPFYSATGVVGNLQLGCMGQSPASSGGTSAWTLTAGHPFNNALFDGTLHQFAYEVERLEYDGGPMMRERIYLDGHLVDDRGLVVDQTGAWTDTDVSQSLTFGIYPGLSGTGPNGKLYRAAAVRPKIAGARAFGDAVMLDWQQSKPHIVAAIAAAAA